MKVNVTLDEAALAELVAEALTARMGVDVPIHDVDISLDIENMCLDASVELDLANLDVRKLGRLP